MATSMPRRLLIADDYASAADAIAEIRGNTRAATDPFLFNAPKAAPKSLLPGVKRKRSVQEEPPADSAGQNLVDYESD